eukprot:scaffold9308_cov136-Isochrysis_galbana.AAC.4
MRMRTHKHSARERLTVQSTRAHGCHDHTHLAPCLAPLTPHPRSIHNHNDNEDRPQATRVLVPTVPTLHTARVLRTHTHTNSDIGAKVLAPGLPAQNSTQI